MTKHSHPDTGTTGATQGMDSARERTTPTLWVGWIWFAGVMMIMAGLFNAIYGLVALFKDDYFAVSPNGLLVLNLTGWGWVHLIVGGLAVITGVALLAGAEWARIVAVVLAAFNACTQLAFLSAYPVWSVIVIALDVVVIWALIVHGDEIDKSNWA